jgi:type IV pilus assembly protein PilW
MNGRAIEERRKPAAGSGGFTLMETLVALCLGVLVIGGLASFFRTQGQALKSREGVVEMHQSLRAAMAVMIGELRMAGFNPLRRIPLGIAAAGSDSITFRLDRGSDRDGIDNDGNGVRDDSDPGGKHIPNGTPEDPNEWITYRLYGRGGETVLGRRSTRNGSFQPLAESVESLRFVYYGDAAAIPMTAPVADPGTIRSIGIVLKGRTAEPDPVTGKHRTFILASRVSPWNLQ